MNVPYVECIKEKPTLSLMPLQVREGTVSPDQLALLAASAQLAMKGCECGAEQGAVYAAVPEWWQIRPEASRPQLVLQFCAKLDNGKWSPPKYSISLPHPKIVTKLIAPPLPLYEKGNFEVQLRLKDNSKLILNCKSTEECKRVINLLRSFIKNEMLVDSDIKFSERRGKEVKEQKMAARIVTYFEKGLIDAADYKWKVKFDLPTS